MQTFQSLKITVILKLTVQPLPVPICLCFNTQSEEFSDVNVRKAVTMAINKEGFVNTLMNGFGEVAQLCYPASYEFGDSKVKRSGI